VVRVVTYYGTDNQIDGVVLDVLLRKHKTIRSSLGISVPVPVDTEQVIEAIFEGLLLRSKPTVMQDYLPGFNEYIKPQKEDLFSKWEAASERKSARAPCLPRKRSKSMKWRRSCRQPRQRLALGWMWRSSPRRLLRHWGRRSAEMGS
jgi:hypothetical protein